MANSRFYSSIAAVTNLQVTASPSDASIQVASSSGWPGTFPYIVSLDYGAANEELVLVTAGGPTTFTVTRAYDGTSATTHNAGAVVRHVSSAIDFTDSRTHEAATTGVHGTTGAIVDTSSTQTMTNKTLTSPVLNNPTLGGTMTATGATLNGGTYTSSTLTNPTINAATVTGTVAGTPTLSGAYTSTGGPSFTTAATTFSRTNSGDVALQTKRTADTNPTLSVFSTGTLQWGSGSGAGDAALGRTGAGAMSLTGSLATSAALTVGTTLGVTGATTLSGGVTVTGNASVSGDLSVSGIGQSLFARKTADTTRTSSVTMADDPHLTFTVTAGALYVFRATLFYNAASTPDINVGWRVPTFGSGTWCGFGAGRDATATIGTAGWTIRPNATDINSARSYGGDTTDLALQIEGFLNAGSAGGTFALQWAQFVSDATGTILRSDSFMQLTRVG